MTVSLCDFPCGILCQISALTGDAGLCQRLRELGVGESAIIKKVGGSGPFLCQINGTRMAIAREAAAAVLVAPLR